MKAKKEIKNTNGITLIALVITIIVLLILAGVTIATLTGDNGIITRTSDAKEETEIASIKEQVQLDIAAWTAERLKNGESTKLNDEIVKSIIQEKNTSNENKYYVELESDRIITQNGYEILYSEFYKNEGYELEIGDYVKYNVSYKDMYSNYEFTANDGWRILDKGTKNNDGTYSNVKIISTGVPVKISYSLTSNMGNSNNGWWATDSQVKEVYGEEYSTGYSNYPNRYAAIGLLKNFESILFNQGDVANTNQGTYTKINMTETGNIYGTTFKTEKASEVHALTLEELNKARGLSSSDNTAVSTTNDGDTGLFYLRDLINENTQYNYTDTMTTAYWLGTAYIESNNTESLYMNGSTGGIVSWKSENPAGVRVVLTLNANIKEVSKGHWKIL